MRGSRTLAAVLSSTLLAALSLAPEKLRAQQAPAPAVVVAPAAIMDLRETADFTGRIVAVQKVDIRARVSGFLEKVNFTEGQKVIAGTVLYEVEDGTYRAAVQEIQGSIEAAEASRELAVLERDRAQRLISSNTVAQATVDTANAQVKKAEADIVRLKGSKQAAELNLSYTRIVAPFDGIVGLSAVDVGGLVGPDSGSLVTLTRLDPISVQFPVATSILLDYRERSVRGEVPAGGDVEITLPNGTTYPKRGVINFVASDVSQGTDTITVRAELPNPDSLLLDGTLVRVTFEQTEKQEVLAVPQQAIQRDQQGAFVMVVGADSKVELRRVDVARSSRGQAVIAKGLKEGEQVITEGVGKVRPGVTVDAAPAAGG
ncbi:acriflavin resistance protein [Sinorhizobium fredii USDA 205]|uniref:Efflux RND transporter periplasmic adaptor subunit n=1 Tax=Rhizobium fredii TaxID=380 RepID=A0A844ACY3_RHIFR|nr:efflux RND transporter periplasmic adaptor subunit [Sinorhizobium fredii]AWM25521.1 RND efflux system membrane fusion protein CmeA [Sinorhizobium fredii CCBAU 25509]KSV81978.1 acriflavin resistance protein [Sinorhizobium fredii USDA 205]MQW93464.1 efflux RND transporter periplasmic adaptor subunit [Sinorhizobium fredii]MQX09705.1 efflux RND transporter periplasmic adaptor subunit [Sinorhizobium fredii]UTY49686.1 efflux RND transporter periplasmic adaptor subunit [Sinorhizobium fredii]